MNPTFSSFSYREYCSEKGGFSSSFHTLEAGVRFVENILQKKTLCCHDVIHINEAYHTIRQLESKAASTSDSHFSAFLIKLAQRVEMVKNLTQMSAEEIITAYHLKHLKIFPPHEVNTSFLVPVNLPLEKLEAIATHLPFCKSGERFELDVKALLGKNPSPEITALLQAKKDQFYEYQQRINHLKELREKNASLYPYYLEEILHGGFICLYDHLVAMKALATKAERSAAIENLSFSSFAKIILEFRKATLSKVKKMMPQENPNIVFLLGNTGAGKSTTLCYLRGDQMLFQNGAYESSTDKGHLIGGDGETSCTLFPNMTVKDDLVIVDFPGFADTHGEVISLAIELTLRALTRKYSPKIVLLTSITDTESRFEHIHLLGKRLERVLGTLDNCLLGLTKYSKDIDFINIKNIEEQQRKELLNPSKEEENIIQQIKALEPFAGTVPAIQAQVDQFKGKLSQIQELRCSSSHQTLPNTEEKSRHYENLLQKEEAFKKHSGIKNIISLKDLTDVRQLDEIVQTLKLQEKTAPIVAPNQLDPADEKLLDTLFTKNLISVITAQENHSTPSLDASATSKDDFSQKIKTFGQSILETSLINTLLEKSHPEIGEFLHLESMDQAIVRKYDKEVITDCINGYIDDVISGLLVAEDLIKELKEKYSLQQNPQTSREWASLRSYILTLSKGIPPNADPHKIKEAWELLHKEYQERLSKSEEELKLPGWLEVILLVPLGIPYGIFSLFKKIKRDNISQTFMNNRAEGFYQSIKAAGEAVIALKDIENIVKKKDQFDAALSSYPLSLDSVHSLRESIQNQITQIEKIYGKKDWDQRVTLIMDQLLSFSYIRPNSPLGETLLYGLLSQEVPYQDLPPYFNEHTFLALIYTFLSSPLGSDFKTPTGKYQETLKQLFPEWQPAHHRDLYLNDSSYFFYTSSVTDQEYHLLCEQRENLLNPYNKNAILHLLFADAVYRLWKAFPLIPNDNKRPGLFNNSIKNDQAKILDAVKKNAWMLEYSKERLREDKEFISAAVKVNGKALAFAHESLKNDPPIVLAAIEQNGSAFQFASEALKNDRKFILTAIKLNGSVLQFASQELQNDRGFVLSAINQDRIALHYVNETLKNDKEFILAAVRQNGFALEFASEAFKSDKEFILVAIKQNAFALEFISEALKNDKEFMLAAVRHNGLALEFVSWALKNDKEFMLAAQSNSD